MMTQGILSRIVPALMILLISVATFSVLREWHTGENWDELRLATQGVVEGKPHWRAFQNRLLSPWVIHVLATVTGSYKLAFYAFITGGILVHNAILYTLLRRQSLQRDVALLWTAFWCFLFLALQHFWFYPWDMVDVVVFTITSYVIVFRRPARWIWLVFPVALLNRESALFLPLAVWLMRIFEAQANGTGWLRALYDRGALAIYAVVLASIAFIKTLRDVLFQGMHYGGTDTKNAVIGNHINFAENLHALTSENFFGPELVHTLALAMTLVFVIAAFLRFRDPGIRAGVAFFIAWLINIMLFGLINETRMLFPLLGLVMFLWLATRAQAEPGRAG